MTDSQMGKVKFGQRLKAGSKQAGFGVLFVTTYHPKLKKTVQIVKKLEHLLYQDESVRRVFTPPPMVSYRSARKLSSYLVRARLYRLEKKGKEAPISVTNSVNLTRELVGIFEEVCSSNLLVNAKISSLCGILGFRPTTSAVTRKEAGLH